MRVGLNSYACALPPPLAVMIVMAARFRIPRSGVIERRLSLYQIRVDGGTQPRLKMNHSVVRSYAEQKRAGAKFPPIDVFFDGTDHFLGDGFYRVASDKELNRSHIKANIHRGGAREAYLFGLRNNRTHGQPLTNEDKRAAVRKILKDPEMQKLSDNAIAALVGVTHPFVGSMRSTCNVTSERIGKDGRKINTANIGRRSARSERRDKHEREAETVELLAMADQLGKWAAAFDGRFAQVLNPAMMHVRRQAYPSFRKRETIADVLQSYQGRAISLENLEADTGFDEASLTRELEPMASAGVVARDGSQWRWVAGPSQNLPPRG